MTGWAIYELNPAPWGDDYRFVVLCESEIDAKTILKELYKVDRVMQNCYRIVEY